MRHVLDQVTLRDLLLDEASVVRRLREQLPREPAPLLSLLPLSRG